MNVDTIESAEAESEFDFGDLDLGELTVTSMRSVAQPGSNRLLIQSSCSCCTWQYLTL